MTDGDYIKLMQRGFDKPLQVEVIYRRDEDYERFVDLIRRLEKQLDDTKIELARSQIYFSDNLEMMDALRECRKRLEQYDVPYDDIYYFQK